MLVGNIVFMNFLIAVVNQSYESCMMTMKQQQYRSKLGFLVMTEKMYEDYYIIENKEGEEEEGSGEWQGMVKEIKNDMKLKFDINKRELITSETKGQKEIIMIVKEMNKQNEAKMEELNRKS